MSEPRKIGLFGGTFDPVHLGHVHLADLARRSLELDEVRFIPCQISPHKTGTRPASPAARLEMLKLATAGLPWAVVDDIELTSGGPNFSYLTAEKLHRKFPDDRLFWIMGGDQWAALPTWKQPENHLGEDDSQHRFLHLASPPFADPSRQPVGPDTGDEDDP